MRWYAFIFIIGAICVGIKSWPSDYKHPPGILVRAEPQQNEAPAKKWSKNGYLLTPLASYDIRARVILTDNYGWGSAADLSPKDLTVAWGPLSDTAYLKRLTLSHSNRYATWRSEGEDIDPTEINNHIANMHIIPADILVERKLKKVKVDDIIRMVGYLVQVDRPDGFTWVSSTTREDNGMGACEIMWVDSLDVAG